MDTTKTSPTNIDAYIAEFPAEVQLLLEQIRATIKNTAPEATEAISYGMPTFKQNGNLVHFAAHKQHIGFYPLPSSIIHFRAELAEYPQAKGSVQFPFNKPLPLNIVSEIVKFRLQENNEKAASKRKKKC